MSWADLPATEATDWQRTVFVGQFVAAINERRQVIDASLPMLDAPAVGANLQARTTHDSEYVGWRVLQQAVEGLVGSNLRFLRVAEMESQPTEAITPYMYSSVFTLRSNAGLESSGFTRRFPRIVDTFSFENPVQDIYGNDAEDGQRAFRSIDPEDPHRHNYSIVERIDGVWTSPQWDPETDPRPAADTLEAYGLMEKGDYIGPWIFNEMHACLGLLRWVLYTGSSNIENLSGGLGKLGSSQFEHSYGDAVSAAIGNWSGVSPSSSSISEHGFNLNFNDDGASDGEEDWTASVKTTEPPDFRAIDQGSGHTREETGYVNFSTPFIGSTPGWSKIVTFDASHLGYPDARPNRAAPVELVTVSSPHTFSFPVIDVQPNPPDPPPNEKTSAHRGVVIGSRFVIAKFDVPGGFEYVD